VITVEYPPGSTDPIHRHNAHGSLCAGRSNRDAGARRKEVTLTPGQTFYEGRMFTSSAATPARQTGKIRVFFVEGQRRSDLVPAKWSDREHALPKLKEK